MGKPKKKLSAYNRYMSKALKGKMTGKTKAQRKAIFKAAAKGWNKGKSIPRSSKSKSRASPEKRSNPTGGTRRMGKSTFNMNKIYGLVRKAAIVLPAAMTIVGPGTPQQKAKQLSLDYFGFNPDDGSFKWERLQRGWMPAIAAQVVTRVIPAINRIIRSFT